MRLCRLLATLALATVTLSAQANPVGSWNAVFVGPMGDRPKMVDAITFSIQSTPAGLTGVARAADWPGDLVVTDLKLEGNRLSFTGTGKRGWSSSLPGSPPVYHCCPKLVFAGTIQGDEMKLEMTWTSTEVTNDANARTVPMEAKRVARYSWVRILARELLLFACSVVVLTTVLAVFNWRFGGPTHGDSIAELGVKSGATAYVLGGVARLMLRAASQFKKWAQGVRKT